LRVGVSTTHGLRAGMPDEAGAASRLPEFQPWLAFHVRRPDRLRQFARKRVVTCGHAGRPPLIYCGCSPWNGTRTDLLAGFLHQRFVEVGEGKAAKDVSEILDSACSLERALLSGVGFERRSARCLPHDGSGADRNQPGWFDPGCGKPFSRGKTWAWICRI
jgi:hypothetical protein